MDSFSDRLKTVLADPDAMAKITELAKNFAAGEKPKPPSEEKDAWQERETGGLPGLLPSSEESNPFRDLMRSPAISNALKLLNDGSRERVALLQAMRPFVRDEKKGKLDSIIQTMKVLDLISSAQKFI